MSDFRRQYKEKAYGFGDINEGRQLRVEKHEKSRKNQRAKTFNEHRNTTDSASSTPQSKVQPPSVVEDRMTRMLKWKAERERQRKMEKTKKKPAFRVGIVHHNWYSPMNKNEVNAQPSMHKATCNQDASAIAFVSKRVTRATEKRLKQKALTEKAEKRLMKSSNPISKIHKAEKNERRKEQSFAPVDHKFKAPIGLPQMPLFGRVMLKSMSPGIASGFMSSSLRTKSMKSSTTDFIIEDINDEKSDIPMTENKKDTNDAEESSIETVSLKLSSDEEEMPILSNTNNNYNVVENAEVNKDASNNSIMKTRSSLRNNCITLNNSIVNTQSPSRSNNIIFNNSLTEAQFPSKRNNIIFNNSVTEARSPSKRNNIIFNNSVTEAQSPSCNINSTFNSVPRTRSSSRNNSIILNNSDVKMQSPSRDNSIILNNSLIRTQSPLSNNNINFDNSITKTGSPSRYNINIFNDSITQTQSLSRNDNITPNNSFTRKQSDNNTFTSEHSDSPNEPIFFSPYVVSSRGKSNARKEQQLKRGFSLGHSSSDEIPTKDTVMKSLNISVEEEERTSQYFQFLLNKEIERLNELCDKWVEIKEESKTPEDGQYQINQAIGQTNLLINKKFERFRGLVSDCETGKGEMLVTCKDLQGFWDMMYMEVKDCHLRFEKLEKLRSEGWKEEQPSFIKPVIKKKITAKKKVVPAKSSSLRAFLAKRKKKMSQQVENADSSENHGVINKETVNDNIERKENSPSMKQKTRRSMSIGVSDTKFTPAKREATRLSLLQKVQLSESTKKMKSPLTIMKISKMCKTPEVQLDDTISYVNSDQTPGKSILKQPKDSDSSVKSLHKVNFNDDIVLNDVPIEEEAQTKKDLAAALARIDSFDIDSLHEEVPINAERKLFFDDNSFEESENVFDAEHSELNDSMKKSKIPLPLVQVQSATPLQELRFNEFSKPVLQTRSFRRQNVVTEDDIISHPVPLFNIIAATPLKEITDDTDLNVSKQKLQEHVTMSDEETEVHNESVRVLRNRTVTSAETSTPKKSLNKVSMNVQGLEHKENKTPSKTRRKSSMKVSIRDSEKMDLHEGMNRMSLNANSERRRSTRRSVKFFEQECTGCANSKPVLPMTPHVRRSKIQSSEKKRRSALPENLISFKTPEKPPERIRRSHHKKV